VREILRLVVVLTVICAASGFSLAVVHQLTKAPIEDSKFKNLKEPAVKAVLSGYENNPIKERITIPLGKDKKGRALNLTVFPAKKGGKTFAVAYESAGRGYHGDIGVMVGVDTAKNKLTGIYIVDQSETPGKGDKVKEPAFTGPFKDKPLDKDITKDQISALSGATLSTNAVLSAVNQARELYAKHRDKMVK